MLRSRRRGRLRVTVAAACRRVVAPAPPRPDRDWWRWWCGATTKAAARAAPVSTCTATAAAASSGSGSGSGSSRRRGGLLRLAVVLVGCRPIVVMVGWRLYVYVWSIGSGRIGLVFALARQDVNQNTCLIDRESEGASRPGHRVDLRWAFLTAVRPVDSTRQATVPTLVWVVIGRSQSAERSCMGMSHPKDHVEARVRTRLRERDAGNAPGGRPFHHITPPLVSPSAACCPFSDFAGALPLRRAAAAAPPPPHPKRRRSITRLPSKPMKGATRSTGVVLIDARSSSRAQRRRAFSHR